MTRYANLGGRSNVFAYEIGSTYIDVVFCDRSIYRYSYASAGSYNIERMKNLARQGCGLNSYIMYNCKYGYESKSYLY